MSEQADGLRELVRERYAAAATMAATGAPSSCCDSTGQAAEVGEDFGAGLYAETERGELPAEALAASLGCGNPLAATELRDRDTVLDLGSGGGIDVLLSARRVGPTGKAYGLDMTTEMLQLARANAARAGATNVEFLQGTIEAVPLPSLPSLRSTYVDSSLWVCGGCSPAVGWVAGTSRRAACAGSVSLKRW